MTSGFSIVSDGSCDLPEEIVEEKDIGIVHFMVSFDGKDYQKEGLEISLQEFYQRMTDHPGTYPMSACPSPEDFYEQFKVRAERGQDILCICISTKLSASVQSAEIAKQMLAEDYPDIRVEVVDSLCATLMQSAYVLEVCRLRDAGKTLDETLELLEPLRKSARIFLTVGDLDYIRHGGRIGKMTSVVGSRLNIKPLITLQDGEIHSSGIRRGRRKSLEGIVDLLIDYLHESHCTPDDCRILLGYSYDREEGERVRELTTTRLKEAFGSGMTEDIPLLRIGATIGVHAGPTSIGYGVIRRSDRLG